LGDQKAAKFSHAFDASRYCASLKAYCTDPTACRKEHQMLDLILLALGLGFFVLTIGYAYACDRL
jgi:hypothetical protein